MSDLRQRILDILTPPHLACLATVTEDGKPWVRYMIPRASDDMTIRVCCKADSRKVGHVALHPEVHFTCGVTDPRQIGTYLQILGLAQFDTSPAERHAFWDPHLENIFEGPDDPNYALLIIKPYRIEVWGEATQTPEVWTPAN